MKARDGVVLVAACLVAALTARLGWWQLDRAAQKQALQNAIEERGRMPPLRAADLARDAGSLEGQLHRSVQIEGIWMPELTVYLENRQMQGRPGFFVVTPLRLADGTSVLVQRGWLPRDVQDRTRVQAPTPPSGVGTVSGRMAGPPARLYEFDGTPTGAVRQNLDIESFAKEHRLRLRPLSVWQTQAQDGEAPGLSREWAHPGSSVHKHYGYAFQWFALSLLTVGLFIWFQIIRPLRRGAHRLESPT